MTFENLNYSTVDKVDNTIQDLIDTNKLDVNNITKEKLKTLKVEIFDKQSYLKLRDIKGNIKGKLNKDGENLKFLGGKFEHNGKTFLEVENAKGDKGYVSADYVIGVFENLTQITNVPESSNKSPIISTDPIIPAAPNSISKGTEKDKSELTYDKKMIMKDGRIFLVGPDGKKMDYAEELTSEDKEKIKKFEQLMILNELLEIWKSEATNVVNSLYRKEWRNDDEIILAQIEEVNKLFLEGFISAQKGGDIIPIIDGIFTKINIAEKEKAIVGKNDMTKVKEILKKAGDKDQQLIQIFNLMRYKGLSGNKNEIKEKTSNHLLADEKFSDIKNILENPELVGYIENNNSTELEKLIGKETTKEILKAYKKLIREQQKYRDEYSKEYNKLISDGKIDQKIMKLNDYINSKAYYQTFTLLKHALLRNKVAKMKDRGTEETSYTGLYANISGLGMLEGNDWHVISDDNIDTAIDIGSTLALSAVSMGVGAIAARGALAVATWGANALKVTNGVNRLGKGAGLTKWAGTAGVEGLAFYEGTNLTNNLIYGSNSYKGLGENAGNGKEILKSIAFMGVLRGFTNLMGTEKAIKLTSIVPKKMLKTRAVTSILSEAGLITGTSVGLEIVFEGEGNFTVEEYLQALLMVGLFRAVGKANKETKQITYKATKSNEGIKLIEYKPFTEVKEFPGFFKGVDGEFYIFHKGQYIKKRPNNPNSNNNGIKLIEHKPFTEVKEFPGFFKGVDGEFYIIHKGQYIKKNPNNPNTNHKQDTIIIGEKTVGKAKTTETSSFTETIKPANAAETKTDNLPKDEKLKIKKNLKEKLDGINKSNIVQDILKTPELLKSIDAKLLSLPLHLNKPYKFSKWLLYKNKVSNWLVNSTYNAVTTPIRVIKDAKNTPLLSEQGLKNVLFANKDITLKNGILKIGGLAVIPTAIEEFYKFNTEKDYNINLDGGDLIGDYVSNMYGGVLNSLIYEYLNSNIDMLPGE